MLDSHRTLDIQYDSEGLMYKKTLTKTEEGSVYREIMEYYYSGGTLRGFQVSKYQDSNTPYESRRMWLLYDETGDLIGI